MQTPLRKHGRRVARQPAEHHEVGAHAQHKGKGTAAGGLLREQRIPQQQPSEEERRLGAGLAGEIARPARMAAELRVALHAQVRRAEHVLYGADDAMQRPTA